MKKIILSAFAVIVFSAANAQIKTNAGTFTKPTSETIIVEATMTPDLSGGGGIFSLPKFNSDLGLLGIKACKFSSDSKALRLGANLSVSSSGIQNTDTEFSLGVSAGIENHMKGAERFSTYWGYEGYLGFVSSYNDDMSVIKTPIYLNNKTTKFGIGANLFTGFDYYIMPKIYLGAEVSYGLAITNTKANGGEGITKIELSPSITPSFRLGWQF